MKQKNKTKKERIKAKSKKWKEKLDNLKKGFYDQYLIYYFE